MMRTAVYVMILVACLPVVANATTTTGHRYGERGEGRIEFLEGDTIWDPTADQLAIWVNDGINAAAAETPLHQIAGIAAWEHSSAPGALCYDGRMRFAIALTPQYIATAAGWASSWDPATWEQILIDQNAVAQNIARRLSLGRELCFWVGIQRADLAAPMNAHGAVYYKDGWRGIEMGSRWSVSAAADDQVSARFDAAWAGAYALAWAMYGLADAGSITIATGLLRHQPRFAPQGIVRVVPRLPGGIRLAIGRPEEWAYCDF